MDDMFIKLSDNVNLTHIIYVINTTLTLPLTAQSRTGKLGIIIYMDQLNEAWIRIVNDNQDIPMISGTLSLGMLNGILLSSQVQVQ